MIIKSVCLNTLRVIVSLQPLLENDNKINCHLIYFYCYFSHAPVVVQYLYIHLQIFKRIEGMTPAQYREHG